MNLWFHNTYLKTKLLLCFLFGVSVASNAQQIDVGLFESAESNSIEVRLKPDFAIEPQQTITAILYTIRWDDPDIEIEVQQIFPYYVLADGPAIDHNGYVYQVFAAVPMLPVGANIEAGEEILVSSFSYTGGACSFFEIIEDEWTADNNGDYYIEFLGYVYTGIIYEPLLQYGSAGGQIAENHDIYLGQQTETLYLMNHYGSVLNWQKQHNTGSWQNITGTAGQTELVYLPETPGIWRFRAVVQQEQCPPDYSSPATVHVMAASLWQGTQSNSWADPLNWTGLVPNTELDAIIPQSPPGQHPTITADASCKNLLLHQGAQLTIEPSGSLTVDEETVQQNESILLIRSDQDQTGSFIHHSPGIVATIEMFFPGWSENDADQYDFAGRKTLSSAVYNKSIQPIFISDPPTENEAFYKWDEALQQWISAMVGDEPPFAWNPEFETQFETGKGYLVAYRDSQIKEFNGILNTNDVSIENLPHTGGSNPDYPGMHLLGNPFASALQWDPLSWSSQNIGNYLLFWDTDYAGFRVLPPDGLIPQGSGFMVYVAEEGNGSINIPAQARVHPQQNGTEEGWQNALVIEVSDTDFNATREIIIKKNAAAPNQFDPYFDAPFFPGIGHQFYILAADQKKLMLRTLSHWDADESLPLGFFPGKSNAYSLQLKTSMPGVFPLLHDMLTDSIHNLADEPTYTFYSGENDQPERFALLFGTVNTSQINTDSNLMYVFDNQLIVHNINGDQATLGLYSLDGRITRYFDASGFGKHYFSLNLQPGIYIARLKAGKNHETLKFMIRPQDL